MRNRLSRYGLAAALFALLSAGVADTADIDDGLVLHYEFEGDGDVLIDTTGNGFDGSLGTATRTDDGLIGKGIEFTSPDHYADAAIAEGLVATDAFTASVWAKPIELNPDGENRVIYKHDQFNLDLQYGRGRLEVHSGGRWHGTDATALLPVALDKWLHMALTYAPSVGASMYHNGTVVAANPDIPSLDATNDYWRIGNLGHAAFVGIVDELRWYHRRMSDVEVLELYQAAAAVSPRGSLTTTWGKLKSTR